MRNLRISAWTVIATLCVSPLGVFGQKVAEPEPNVAVAKLWWPDQRNVWTPIGWKDHFFRFNVLYNGTAVFEPFSDMSSRANARKWKGTDFQLAFTPWPNDN